MHNDEYTRRRKKIHGILNGKGIFTEMYTESGFYAPIWRECKL
jgi:hypothetical protein